MNFWHLNFLVGLRWASGERQGGSRWACTALPGGQFVFPPPALQGPTSQNVARVCAGVVSRQVGLHIGASPTLAFGLGMRGVACIHPGSELAQPSSSATPIPRLPITSLDPNFQARRGRNAEFARRTSHIRIAGPFHSSRSPSRRRSTPQRAHAMADSNAPKPSSSVKLVLLGEAAVGKVGFIDTMSTSRVQADRVASIVVSRPAIRQQRLPREQGADNRR